MYYLFVIHKELFNGLYELKYNIFAKEQSFII